MCGIAGFSGNVAPERLQLAVERLRHRGPDDEGIWIDQERGVGLGHTRLSINDLSEQGHQPMVSSDGLATIVFNGEIYNFHELRDDLARCGHVFRGGSDTEVLLQLYRLHGEAMLPLLNGIFTFAIYNNEERHVFVARDGLGVKPLYFCESDKSVVFASELKGLLPMLPGNQEIDFAALHRYLTFLWCPGGGTPFAGVKKLLPGEAIIIAEGKIQRRWSWYHLPVFDSAPGYVSEQAAIKGVAEGLRTAVKRQLVADVPVGAFLSGGLDSTSVVTFAREFVDDLHCFTIEASGGTDEGDIDDLPYAKKAAEHLGVSLDIVKIEAGTMAADIENMIQILDEPIADPASLNVLYISRLARESGFKVLLSGAGGDDLFSGYRRHVALKHEYLWSWIPGGVRRMLATGSARLDQRRSFSRRAAKLLSAGRFDGNERLINYFRWTQFSDLMPLYTEEFASQISEGTAGEPMLDFVQGYQGWEPQLEQMLALEQRFFLADHNLIYTDKMSMATGVEVRVPFLDPDLVDFAMTIPEHVKQRGRVGKWVLKKAMEPYLPNELIYRKKTGFGAPLRRWMRNELGELLGDVLSVSSLQNRGLFDPRAVQSLISRNNSGEIDASYTLLSLLSIEIWCRRFFDEINTGDSYA